MRKYLFFGSGSAGLSIVNILVQTWLIYFFAPSRGRVLIPASVVGIIWFIGSGPFPVSPHIADWYGKVCKTNRLD